MKDLAESSIFCEKCNRKAQKGEILREGFRIRIWQCPDCREVWYHPLDLNEYEQFKKLRNRQFQVKLRMVGNSWAVSIPREIIEFQQDMENEMKKHMEHMSRIVRLCMEEPGKLSLFFNEKEAKKGKVIEVE
jgi:ribosomal protein L37AE/L43A